MEMKTMVINSRLHVQGEDGFFRRMPLGMDEARSKEDYPVYRMENGKPVEVEPQQSEFKAREVLIAEDAPLPDFMREHFNNGGKLYMVEEPRNDKAFVSTSENRIGALCAHIDMKYVIQEVRVSENMEKDQDFADAIAEIPASENQLGQ